MTDFAWPEVGLAKSPEKKTDIVVVGLADVSGTPEVVGLDSAADKALAKRFGCSVAEAAAGLGASPKQGSATLLPGVDDVTRVLVVGLGEGGTHPDAIRRAAGTALRIIAGLKGADELGVAVSLDTADEMTIGAAAEGALMGSYRYAKVSGTKPGKAIGKVTIIAPSTDADAKQAITEAEITARATCLAREWINIPPNLLYPETFADSAVKEAKGTKIDVEVWDEARLAKEGFGGILTVGNGSSRKPRLVRYSYAPKGADFHLALVGKGITFDSGGLDIKPADGMYDMKCDMGGAATVLAATRAIAELGLKVKVTCWAAMAENMPSGEAYRPSDVLTMYGGTTVENTNTDAEGRLVMADALARANEDNPDCIVDVATLTGACVVALGNRIAGLMASDEQTADVVLDAAEVAGEAFWQLPMTEQIRESLLASEVADIKSGASRMGGAMVAASFLNYFVDEDTPYAHLDIAGPAFNTDAAFDWVGKGGTGHGVRTLIALAASLQK